MILGERFAEDLEDRIPSAFARLEVSSKADPYHQMDEGIVLVPVRDSIFVAGGEPGPEAFSGKMPVSRAAL